MIDIDKETLVEPKEKKKKEGFVLKIDPKRTEGGDLVTGTEGPMHVSDSIRKKTLVEGKGDE